MNGKPFFEIHGLTCNYRGIPAVRDLRLSVGEGEIVTLIGNNGSGKTTILGAICGVLPDYASLTGDIIFHGKQIRGLPSHEIVRRGISLVPEGRRIFPQLRVEENLLMGSYRRNPRKTELKNTLDEVYRLFPILQERRHSPGGGLSGGQQQMLAIGRALMADPGFLLLDEPSLGLAPLLVQEIFEIIQRIHKKGTSILLVEQNARLALKTASRAYVLEKGRTALEGPREELLQDKKVRDIYLGESF
ncbi:MAG: ABC transporter ATP-binding protein [Spirochaetales bacterium]|jgi:branched-chain amino acid transport system ATP-binding protein|nr:ABC transporter ATP-binding protein [Spirochaetales bacterium]